MHPRHKKGSTDIMSPDNHLTTTRESTHGTNAERKAMIWSPGLQTSCNTVFPVMWVKKTKKPFIVLSTFKLTFCCFKSVASYVTQNNKAKYTI